MRPELEQDQSTHVVVEVDLERPGEGEEHVEAGVGASWVLADVSRDLIDGEFDLVAVQYPTVPKDPDGVAITRIFDALGGWTIEVHERRPRIRPEGSPGPDVPDVVLRARRRR